MSGVTMKRLSISLDQESLAIIDKYIEKYKGSKANILRKALQCLKMAEETQEKISFKTIKTYIDFLAKMEHVIVDIAHWKTIFTEIGEGSGTFWDEIRMIGEAHTREYYDKGIRGVQEILEYVEKTNWYVLNIDSEDSYTLVLTVSEAGKFVKTFFEGFFKNYPKKVEIREDYKKIRVLVQ